MSSKLGQDSKLILHPHAAERTKAVQEKRFKEPLPGTGSSAISNSKSGWTDPDSYAPFGLCGEHIQRLVSRGHNTKTEIVAHLFDDAVFTRRFEADAIEKAREALVANVPLRVKEMVKMGILYTSASQAVCEESYRKVRFKTRHVVVWVHHMCHVPLCSLVQLPRPRI